MQQIEEQEAKRRRVRPGIGFPWPPEKNCSIVKEEEEEKSKCSLEGNALVCRQEHCPPENMHLEFSEIVKRVNTVHGDKEQRREVPKKNCEIGRIYFESKYFRKHMKRLHLEGGEPLRVKCEKCNENITFNSIYSIQQTFSKYEAASLEDKVLVSRQVPCPPKKKCCRKPSQRSFWRIPICECWQQIVTVEPSK